MARRPTLSFATRDFVAKHVVEYAPFPPPLHVDVATFSLYMYVFIFNSCTIFLNRFVSVKTTKSSNDRKLFQPHLKKLGIGLLPNPMLCSASRSQRIPCKEYLVVINNRELNGIRETTHRQDDDDVLARPVNLSR